MLEKHGRKFASMAEVRRYEMAKGIAQETEVQTLTEHEIIKETIEYYTTHPRGIETNEENELSHCVYLSDDGAMCAVGRCLLPEIREKAKGCTGGILTIIQDFGPLDPLLQPQYRGHDNDFWRALQAFHDKEEYWKTTDTGNIPTHTGIIFLADPIHLNYAY